MTIATRAQSFLERIGFQFREGPKTALFSEQAVDRWLGMVTGVADPDEVLRRAGVSRTSLRALNGDDEITAALDTRREALLSVPWHLDGEGEPVDWLTEQLTPHIERILRGAQESLTFGYSVIEGVYIRDGGRVTWLELTEKPFEWFVPKLDGTVLWRSPEYPQGEPTDPRKYFLTVRNQTYRNPYGEALFSRLYWPWLFRSQGWRFWVKWLERFGTPMLLGQTQGDAGVMATALAKAVQDSTVAVGLGDKVDVVESASGSGHFEGFERAICARIQKVILGQTLTSDSGGSSGSGGSYALGQVHNEVRHERRNADIRAATVTAQRIVDVAWGLNGFPNKPPKFILRDDNGIEPARAERDAKLTQSGAVKLTPEYFLRAYDYEEGDLDVEAMTREPPEPSAAPGAEPPPGEGDDPAETPELDDEGKPVQPAKATAGIVFATKFTPQQQAVEDAVGRVIATAPPPISSAAIRDAISGAEDADDLAQRLAVLLSGRSVFEFEETLARCLFAADLLGYAHSKKE